MNEPGFTQADDELLQVWPGQGFVVGHLREADRTTAMVACQLDHHAHAVLASRGEVHGARAGKDAPRARFALLLFVRSDRRGGCQRRVEPGRIPSYHVRIESSPASCGLQSLR